jgi:hypothetical protein
MTAIQRFRAFRKAMRDAASSASYEAAFRAWAQDEANRRHAAKPWIKPYKVDDWDGCTMAPEIVRPCCRVHDMDYHFMETEAERKKADDDLRECICSVAEVEDAWLKPLWPAVGSVYWAAVRLFGGLRK